MQKARSVEVSTARIQEATVCAPKGATGSVSPASGDRRNLRHTLRCQTDSALLGLRRGLGAPDREVGAAEEEAMDTEARYLSGKMAPRGVEPLEGGHVAARH